MLKLTYTDIGLHLEQWPEAIAQAIERRRTLALHTGETVHVEPSYAAILVPSELPELRALEQAIATTNAEHISLYALAEHIEIILQGCWLTYQVAVDEGIFFTALEPEIENQVAQVWNAVGSTIAACTWPCPIPHAPLVD